MEGLKKVYNQTCDGICNLFKIKLDKYYYYYYINNN